MKPFNLQQKPSLIPSGFMDGHQGLQNFRWASFIIVLWGVGDKWAPTFVKGDLLYCSIIALLQMDDGQIEMAAAAAWEKDWGDKSVQLLSFSWFVLVVVGSGISSLAPKYTMQIHKAFVSLCCKLFPRVL